MTQSAAKKQLAPSALSADEGLIRDCLKSDPKAWSDLIDKYKNLIYSIPIKLGMYQDAGDIFQAVCVELMSQLPQLREHRALPKWLIQTCYRKCLAHQRAGSRHVELDPVTNAERPDEELLAEEMLLLIEKEQVVRDGISAMPRRCRQMIEMLFFEVPARPYDEIAKVLGLATGSIGFIRGRCLARLRKHLEKKGI